MYFLNEEVKTTNHKIKKITLMFEKGHNQSEVDTLHQILEQANKNQEAFVVSEVASIHVKFTHN